MSLDSPWVQNLKESLAKIVEHTVVTLLALGSMALIHFTLKKLLGDDAKFFDYLKVKFFIDAADVAILLRLVIVLLFDIWKIFKRD